MLGTRHSMEHNHAVLLKDNRVNDRKNCKKFSRTDTVKYEELLTLIEASITETRYKTVKITVSR